MPAVAAIAVIAAGSAGTAAVGGAITFGLASGFAASVIGGVVIGAVAGAITAAVMGEDILDGAIKGGLVGGLVGGVGFLAAEGGFVAGGSDAVTVGAEIEAGTGAVANVAPTSTQMVVGTANGAEAIGATAGAVESTGGTILGMSTPELLMVGGSVVSGVGEAYGSKVSADAAEEAANTAYERNKSKLQEGVNLSTSEFAIDKDQWGATDKNTANQTPASATTVQPVTAQPAGAAQTGLLPANAAPSVPTPAIAPPAPAPVEKFDSTVQSGLLNK